MRMTLMNFIAPLVMMRLMVMMVRFVMIIRDKLGKCDGDDE
jgi:hypothetical protein